MGGPTSFAGASKRRISASFQALTPASRSVEFGRESHQRAGVASLGRLPRSLQAADEQIQKDLEAVLELAAAKEATEEQRKAKVELFKGALVLRRDGEPRAAELGVGRYALAPAPPREAGAGDPAPRGLPARYPKSDDAEQATLTLGGATSRPGGTIGPRPSPAVPGRPPVEPQRIVARYYLAVTQIEAGKTDAGIAELAAIAQTGASIPRRRRQPEARTDPRGDRAHAGGTRSPGRPARGPPGEAALMALQEQLDWVGKARARDRRRPHVAQRAGDDVRGAARVRGHRRLRRRPTRRPSSCTCDSALSASWA